MRLSPSIALLRTQSDARLVSLAREGHEPAFTALVERYRRDVGVACRRVLPEARAEDAAQQTFVSAWKALERGDDVREVRPWLLRIARNTSLNALRVQGYDYEELSGALRGGEAPQAELERRDVMRQTLAGLAALPENQREALLRSAVQGASHADIARDLGISEGATRQLVLRARTALRGAVTAVTPLPLVHWAVRAGETAGTETAVRIAEVASAGGAAGASALLAKAGVVAVVAGGAAATPVVLDRGDDGREPRRVANERATPAATAGAPDPTATAKDDPVATATSEARGARPGATPRPRGNRGPARPGRPRPAAARGPRANGRGREDAGSAPALPATPTPAATVLAEEDEPPGNARGRDRAEDPTVPGQGQGRGRGEEPPGQGRGRDPKPQGPPATPGRPDPRPPAPTRTPKPSKTPRPTVTPPPVPTAGEDDADDEVDEDDEDAPEDEREEEEED